MSEFDGFERVRDEMQRGWTERLVAVALRLLDVQTLAGREYVVGEDLATGLRLRATLSHRRSYPSRPSLTARCAEAGGPGGVLVLTDCVRNRFGTFEAFNATAFAPGNPVLVDGQVRIGAPVARDNGSWFQMVQHLRTGQAQLCTGYDAVVDAVLAALGAPGPGRAGAVVRGWHVARGGTMGFEIFSVFDRGSGSCLPPEPSFDAFLMTGDVFVAGLGVTATGEQCMEMVARLLHDSHREVVWEVIPKRVYALGGAVAETAGLRTGRDFSVPYRFSRDTPGATGCLPSVVGFVMRRGALWPRLAMPLRPGQPVPEIRVPTPHVTPAVLKDKQPVPAALIEKKRSPRAFSQAIVSQSLLPLVAAAGIGSPDLGGGADAANSDFITATSPPAPEVPGLRRR